MVVVLHEGSQIEEGGRVWCPNVGVAVVNPSAALNGSTGVCDAVCQCEYVISR